MHSTLSQDFLPFVSGWDSKETMKKNAADCGKHDGDAQELVVASSCVETVDDGLQPLGVIEIAENCCNSNC
jgi:hypothetical protein